MIVLLKTDHKLHLSYLFSQPDHVLQDFCKLALSYFVKGLNSKVLQSASKKLEVDLDVIQNAVEGLVNLLLECCKYQLNDSDFRDAVLSAGFSESHYSILQAFYDARQSELMQLLAERSTDFPHFKDFEWRLEAQVASRALLEQMTPQVMMKLSLERAGETEHALLQADPASLVHVTNELEAALAESNSQHFRRIERRFKAVRD